VRSKAVRTKTAQTSPATKAKGGGQASAEHFAPASRRHRVDLVMAEARKAGLVGGPKDAIIRGRVSKSLIRAAKRRAGMVSDTELIEIALSSFALADDFGQKFLQRKGAIDPDLPLEL
jgi:hypothetical protein